MSRAEKAKRLAAGYMNECDNCAQSVIMAVSEALEETVSPEVINSASLLREGMGGGCTCGALTGAVMISGMLASRKPHPFGDKLPGMILKRFRADFGASCCAVIKAGRPMMRRFSRKPCVELTAATAAWVTELWEEVFFPGE